MPGPNSIELSPRVAIPQAFTQFVIKIQSRCNLNCTYCHVYNAQDNGWRRQPMTMSESTMAVAGRRIAEHAERFGLAAVGIVLHGGEPLIAGPHALNTYASILNREISPASEVRLGVQTNGILLSEEFLEVFDRWSIRVGVSLDGTPDAHDRRRRHHDGRGSHDAVIRAIRKLATAEYRHLFSGLLCVADVEADPMACYRELAGLDPPAIDFLLPHANWDRPPRGLGDRRRAIYADWLITVFDAWYEERRGAPTVRLFEEVIGLLLAVPVRSESVGLSPSTVVIIEANGDIEQVDSLKTAYDGASGTGLNVHSHSLERALWDPITMARQAGAQGLGQVCTACPLRRVCGGGHFAHRYRTGHGFLNPSVYGADLAKLIAHIGTRIYSDLRIKPPFLERGQVPATWADGVRCTEWTP
ncbi:MAG: FxsB family cyclophane-forming radical SAM/SPASM peptide maturase [Trebonia sp.]